MAYCCIACPLRRRRGQQGERPVSRGATCMFPGLRNTCLSAWFGCILLLCMAPTNVWSDTDKTTVDLERGRPGAASRYHRPRAEYLYRYDKTDVDLAAPLAQPSPEAQRASQRPGTLTPAAPDPETPIPVVPRPRTLAPPAPGPRILTPEVPTNPEILPTPFRVPTNISPGGAPLGGER